MDRDLRSMDDFGATPCCRLTLDEWDSLAETLRLTPREVGVVQGFLLGRSETRIGRELGISTNTVHAHVGRIYRKLEVHSNAGLVLRVFAAYVEHVGRGAESSMPSAARSVR